MSRKVLVPLASILFLLLLTAGIDRLLPAVIGLKKPPSWLPLFFVPLSTDVLRTPEFQFTSNTNSLGFRDREFAPSKGDSYRILAIGDSFTYGWGVDIDETWVKVLERNLRQRGLRAEVANLGRPGSYPAKYADVAARMIPVLRPDLVLIAVLQGDDLTQCEQSIRSRQLHMPTISSLRNRAASVLGKLYPNITAIRQRRAATGTTAPELKTASVERAWQARVREVVASATAEQRDRFSKLDEQVKRAYLDGDLNPELLVSALEDPDYYTKTLRVTDPATRSLIEEMAKQLSRAKLVADSYAATVLVVSVPYRAYASRADWLMIKRLGYKVDPAMLTSVEPDEAIRLACQKAGLRFVEVTRDFRRLAEERALYFELDGHFNPQGHQVYGNLLTPTIQIQ